MKVIEPIRGDTIFIVFPLVNEEDETILKEEIETMFLTARQFPSKSSPILFEKNIDDFTLDEDGYNVVIQPEDTQELEDEEIFFDIEITLKDSTRQSKVGKIDLTKDITIHGGVDNEG